MQLPKRLQGNVNMKTITVEVPTIITRRAKSFRNLFESSYNQTTSEVIVLVNGVKFMDQPENLIDKIVTITAYYDALLDFHSFVVTKFGAAVDIAPVARELNGAHVRLKAKYARSMAKLG